MLITKTHPKIVFLFLFIIVFSLQGCGAERDTPFNPTPSSNNSSSLGAAIVVTEVYEGENPINPYEPDTSDHKQFVVIRNVSELDAYMDAYDTSANFTLTDDDFAKGQVILFDQGNIGTCTQKLLFNGSPTAFEFTTHSVKVIFKYRDTDKPVTSNSSGSSASSTSSSSSSSSSSSYSEPTCESTTVKRPYGFYYIPSRKKLLIEEQAAY